MKCPQCKPGTLYVKNSRQYDALGNRTTDEFPAIVERHRKCDKCGFEFTNDETMPVFSKFHPAMQAQ